LKSQTLGRSPIGCAPYRTSTDPVLVEQVEFETFESQITMLHQTKDLLRLLPSALMLLLAGAAQAQSHATESGRYVLRSTTVASEQIDAAAAQRHGVVPAPDRAVVNVVLLRQAGAGADTTVSARVAVSMRTASGLSSDIEMREVRENGAISYLGSYQFLPRQMINFEISAAPTEDAKQQPLKLDYRERMWAH
jgi:hypothetical protein